MHHHAPVPHMVMGVTPTSCTKLVLQIIPPKRRKKRIFKKIEGKKKKKSLNGRAGKRIEFEITRVGIR
jgi:hypothetical protein